MGWLSQYFLNPSILLPGAALVSLPIVIHFLNRLRYRRVRFAAMEFLLKSDKRNRRRVMIEQLILLAMRCAIVLLVAVLIGRLVLDAAQLSLFRGARAHHFVILDDSGSMTDRMGEGSAFDEAVLVVRKLLSEGAAHPGTQEISIMLMSQPDQLLVTRRTVDDALLTEITTKLTSLQCTSRALSTHEALEAARRLLVDDRSVVRQVHVVSDFRDHDWTSQNATAEAIQALDEAEINVNVARVVDTPRDNLAVTQLTNLSGHPAVGVPVRFRIGVRNYGQAVAKNVTVSLFVNEQRLPVTVRFAQIEGGDEAVQEQDLTFDASGQHAIEAALEPDALEPDNARFATVRLVDANPILIIDGDPKAGAARYVEAAIASDPKLTGYSPVTGPPRFLRTQALDEYRCVYMLNVPQLSENEREELTTYVENGGKVIWFLGSLVDAAHYSDKLYAQGTGVFPVPLAPVAIEFSNSAGPDVVFSDHPAFQVFAIEELQFASTIKIQRRFSVAPGWVTDDDRRPIPAGGRSVKTIASLADRSPLAFEHRLGTGRVYTFLTAVDRGWTNWPVGDANPSFVITNLDLQRIVTDSRADNTRSTVGDPIELRMPPESYREVIEIDLPEKSGHQTLRMTATPRPESGSTDLFAGFRETDAPGIYRIRLRDVADVTEARWFAYNVSTDESDLKLAVEDDLRSKLPDVRGLTIQERGATDWLEGREPGHEIRWLLLALLLVFLVGEQICAWKFSYHTHESGAQA